MDERERFETLLVVLDELVEANRSIPVFVEGQRDVAALRALGCAGAIEVVHNGRTLWVLAEETARNGRASALRRARERGTSGGRERAVAEAIVLTDWDRKGETLRDQLSTMLAANGVRVDATFHDRLRDALSMKIKDVESLAFYVENGLARFQKIALADRVRALSEP